MNKEDDIKFLKIQTCVLRVNIHCDGCKQKVKKLLHKIDGVYTTTIDSEMGKVTVSGNVDPATLIRKLVKAGKHAQLWSGTAVKGGNIGNNKQQQQLLNHQFQNLQLDNKKGQKDGKPPKGPGGQDQLKNIPLLPQQLKAGGGAFKDLELPNLKDFKIPFNKDQKKVKFADALDQDDDMSDEFDDEFDDDELDEFDDDFDDDYAIKPQPFHGVPMKPLPMNGQVPPLPQGGHPFMNAPPINVGGHGGGGGNGNKNVQVPIKVGGNSNDGSGKKGGGNNGGGNHNQNPNQNQNGSGGKHGKNGGGNNKNVPIHNGGAAGNNHHPQEPKKAAGGGGGGGVSQKGGPGHSTGFHEIDLSRNGGHGGMAGGPPAQMGYPGMPPAGNGMPAAQGMPMNASCFYRPEMMSAAAGGGGNPYLQQMMMQQQQRHNTGFQPMTYARPPVAVAYAPPYMPPTHYCPPTPEYTHYFSDENTSSCSVM